MSVQRYDQCTVWRCIVVVFFFGCPKERKSIYCGKEREREKGRGKIIISKTGHDVEKGIGGDGVIKVQDVEIVSISE